MSIKINTAYYNLQLLYDLDYVIGGYGKANHEFIFNFNNFVESFILNENFLISNQEWEHHFLTSKAVFNKGLPITNMVFMNSNGINIVGLSTFVKEAKFLYVEKINTSLDRKEKSKKMIDFQDKNQSYLQEKYLKQNNFSNLKNEYNYLFCSDNVSAPSGDIRNFAVLEASTTSEELLTSLYKRLPNSNFQITLPLNGLNGILKNNNSLSISKKTIKILTELHDLKLNEIANYSGYRKIPIPPLVPILLSQCRNIDDIPEKLLQLREDFQELRKSFGNFENRISSSKTIKEQTKIIDEYNSFWDVFNRKNKIKTNRLLYHFWDIGENSGINNSIENSIDSAFSENFLEDLKITKIIGKSVSKIYSHYKDKKVINRFKGVTNLWELFQNSPILENQVSDIERIFKIKVDPKKLKQIVNSIKKNNI